MTFTRRYRAVLVLLFALGGVLLVSRSPLCVRAYGQATGASSPNDFTVAQYVYKGQKYEMRLYRGQLLMVAKDTRPIIMYSGGTAHPISQDSSAVAAAEEAANAYKAGTPSNSTGSTGAAGGAPGSGLTVDGVISLLNAGLSDDLIIAKIQKSGQAFDLSTDDMIRLKKAKASDAVMKAMMNATPAPAAAPAALVAGAGPADAPAASAPEANPVAENPNMGRLPKESFMGSIGHHTTNVLKGRTVIDTLSMRNILPQWDPHRKLSEQYPHIAITVLYAPQGWTEDYHDVLRKSRPWCRTASNSKRWCGWTPIAPKRPTNSSGASSTTCT